jgi:hypothetical protein
VPTGPTKPISMTISNSAGVTNRTALRTHGTSRPTHCLKMGDAGRLIGKPVKKRNDIHALRHSP